MMGLFVRALLVVGGGAAALLVDRGAPNFPIVQSMLALVTAVLALAAVAVVQPAAAWLFKHRASPRGAAWAGAVWRGRAEAAMGARVGSAPALGCDGRAAPERWRSRSWAP